MTVDVPTTERMDIEDASTSSDLVYADSLDIEIANVLNCGSYWARKTKLALLTHRPEFSPLRVKLLEFDIALEFKHVEDVVRVADQM